MYTPQEMRKLTADFASAIAARKLPLAPTRRSATQLLHTCGFVQAITPLFPPTKPFTCAQISHLAAPLLNRIGDAPSCGWLPYTFSYQQGVLFPARAPSSTENQTHRDGARLLLSLMQVFFSYEAKHLPFQWQLHFAHLTADELSSYPILDEYHAFEKALDDQFVYPLFRLADEITPYRPLAHTGGVHHVALSVARALSNYGIGINLPLISAAAYCHDIGKFGCGKDESVPYFHYYYTEQWLKQHNMPATARIAANHSTWDLELDALSAESLCLIYADFRSKQTYNESGQEIPTLFSLSDAFDVILSKLDHVDEEKKRRYHLVYHKLSDFESYLTSLGFDVTTLDTCPCPAPKCDPALLPAQEVTSQIALLAVEHNITMMHRLISERRFGNVIESARSAKNWQQLRAYLGVFEKYSAYLSPEQKTQALSFTFDLLIHRDGDIRRQGAALMGQILGQFHMGYRKLTPAHITHDAADDLPFELFSHYLNQIIYPDHKMTLQQKNHLGYTLKLIVSALINFAHPDDLPRFVALLLRFYHCEKETLSSESAFTLLDAIGYLPDTLYDIHTKTHLINFAGYYTAHDAPQLRASALLFLRNCAEKLNVSDPLFQTILVHVKSAPCPETPLAFLSHKILSLDSTQQIPPLFPADGEDFTGEIFLDNLKNATPWVIKTIGVELLYDQVKNGDKSHILHIATHFSNLVKVSERVVVRHNAGSALVGMLPLLSREQRNEVVIELGRGLEIGQFELSRYIPAYLGQAALFLHPTELDELIAWLKSLLGAKSISAIFGALHTVGVLLNHYPEYAARFAQTDAQFSARRTVLLGLLMQGLSHFQEPVRQEALLVLGNLFSPASDLNLDDKATIFILMYRKFLFLLHENQQQDPQSFFFRTCALSHMGNFLSIYQLDRGQFSYTPQKKIAFFPGTFDPFTLSHKGIVQTIVDLGFEVYLAVDEFSWSKKSQPHLIRRQIVNMSVADNFSVHLFPDDIPVNIANPVDLKNLQNCFPEKNVYLIVGSDVTQNASAYHLPPTSHSVHGFNHIVFHRSGAAPLKKPLQETISGDVIELHLPAHLQDISSSQIRTNIDLNRDISSFIDPIIEDFIYENGLYLQVTSEKPLLSVGTLRFQWVSSPTPVVFSMLQKTYPQHHAAIDEIQAHEDNLLLVYHTGAQDTLLGFIAYRYLTPSCLFSAVKDAALADRIRLRLSGTCVFISYLFAQEDSHHDFAHLLCSELLAQCAKDGCTYGIFHPYTGFAPPQILDLFSRQGFVQYEKSAAPFLYEVDMHAPTVLIQNLETTMQEPFARNRAVLSAISRGHKNLQAALCNLYPGQLVLTLTADIIHQRMLEMITMHNHVSITPTNPRTLGECMCVPFGKLLRGNTVANTVTKTLHTDKVYSADLSSHTIEAFPYYAPIRHQIRTVKSFSRPVILVDDIMHPGNRFRTLDPILREEEVDIRMVLVGILSAHGKDFMTERNRPVDSAYFLPTIGNWFVESTLYPFIGGNTVRRTRPPVAGLLAGINHIFPYANPQLTGCKHRDLIALSRCCIQSAHDVIFTLEKEYRTLYGRNLTLSRLPEAVVLPLCPDKGTCLHYDPNLAPSVYLENDLLALTRVSESEV